MIGLKTSIIMLKLVFLFVVINSLIFLIFVQLGLTSSYELEASLNKNQNTFNLNIPIENQYLIVSKEDRNQEIQNSKDLSQQTINPKNQIYEDLNCKHSSEPTNLALEHKLSIINQFGNGTFTFPHHAEILKLCFNNTSFVAIRKKYDEIQQRRQYQAVTSAIKYKTKESKLKINLASIACGDRSEMLMIMLKSAIIFSQDAHLHVIIIVNDESLNIVVQTLLELKWTVDALELNFSFEIHMEWYPEEVGVNWKTFYPQCSTQLVYFSSLLLHIDSLIYVDTETIVVSNLTELWLNIPDKMNAKIAALAPINEPTASSWYDTSLVPYYGPKGLSAGVMLMNLTEMRQFNFEQKVVGIEVLYRERMFLACQDILNIFFNIFPDKLLELDCSYNFNWMHCGGPKLGCVNTGPGINQCFCRTVQRDGVRIVHGNGGYYFSPNEHHAFLTHLYTAFFKLNLLTDSFHGLFTNLRTSLNQIGQPICFPLSANLLYNNANTYFYNMGKIDTIHKLRFK